MNKKILAAVISLIIALCSFSAAFADDVPYTVSLSGSVEIYKGPGFEYSIVGKIGSDGVFTIVEEAVCEDDYLWGKLKSGKGWVVLHHVASEEDSSGEFSSYTTKLSGDTEIYLGPGYDYGFARYVESDGVYTIVEEAVCSDGYLWGRLKSGAGWVMLKRVIINGEYTESSEAADESYRVQLPYWVPIFNGPGYDYGFVRYIDEDGVFTIVSEQLDEEGNVWGELKSGAGWVDLTYVRVSGQPVLTAMYTNEDFINSGDYYVNIVEDSEYTTYIVFRTSETVYDFDLTLLQYDGENYTVAEKLDSFGIFYDNTPFVAGVVFYGDMTTYGVSFIDANDTERHFAISVSGRNGMLEIEEYVP